MRLVGAHLTSGASLTLVTLLIRFIGSFAHRNGLFAVGPRACRARQPASLHPWMLLALPASTHGPRTIVLHRFVPASCA